MDQSSTISPEELNSPVLFNTQRDSFGSEHALHGGFTELSEALAAAQSAGPSELEYPWLQDNASLNLSNNSTAVSTPLTPGTPITRPKLGSRFSREVIKTLKQWLTVHQQHPYPTEDEMTVLQQRTGLNKAQLTNWFANARRRGKLQSTRPSTPQVNNTSASPVDIIARPGTPAVVQGSKYKNPMQRWVDSPPEHEPADVSDIARAMASRSRRNSAEGLTYEYSDLTYNDPPWQSPYAQSPYARSSASSAGTSLSSEARHSSDSQSSLKLRRVPRRKRAGRRARMNKQTVPDPSMPYQCTFCTEVFRTKYDWQRHEKTLHLPLEQWICALHGPRAARKDSSELCCVFCGTLAPDDTHIELHHYTACQERDLEERTFHRKDHLVQHLRLVHNAKYEQWSMSHWMLPMPDIQSRCGFCSATMNSWMDRADHLADHFKSGLTMANWKGDWGFTDDILKLVECAVPPYFIEYERNSLIPMKASDPPWGSPPNAYEMLKVEIEHFVQNYFDQSGQLPSNDKMQLEACRIVFTADTLATTQHTASERNCQSWLRDLIMSDENLARQARFGPIRTARESRHFLLKINGKDNLFEDDILEAQLQAFVLGQQLSGMKIEDSHIQNEACNIIRRMEKESDMPSDIVVNWIVKGIYSGTTWMVNLKQRMGILDQQASTFTLNPSTIQDLSSFWPDFTTLNDAGEISVPTEVNPQLPDTTHASMELSDLTQLNPQSSDATQIAIQSSSSIEAPIQLASTNPTIPPQENLTTRFAPHDFRVGGFLPDDTNFFRSFENDIKRWVASTMSPKNPNCHVPSDEEIQHQARWIMYGGDDTWNQTPADFAEWMWRFKRDVGILQNEDGGFGVGSGTGQGV